MTASSGDRADRTVVEPGDRRPAGLAGAMELS